VRLDSRCLHAVFLKLNQRMNEGAAPH